MTTQGFFFVLYVGMEVVDCWHSAIFLYGGMLTIVRAIAKPQDVRTVHISYVV